MAFQWLPTELLLHIMEELPLRGLISAYHVNSQLRRLVPIVNAPTRTHLFKLAFVGHDSSPAVSLADRLAYVAEIEGNHDTRIPEPYRTVLTEWPVAHAPRGMHWPHAVRFRAHGFCSCFPEIFEGGVCGCARTAVHLNDVMLSERLRTLIYAAGPTFDPAGLEADERLCSWELFKNPPRLQTAAQHATTARFILAQPRNAWQVMGTWRKIDVRCLRLSRYFYEDDEGNQSEGQFWMVLDGPSRGEIHAWDPFSWYAGFEAENFFDWQYKEWVRPPYTSSTQYDLNDL